MCSSDYSTPATKLGFFAESIILISSELYIVISFWVGTNDDDVDIGFDTAKLIQALTFLLIIITEY
jgi:hypothetical protein